MAFSAVGATKIKKEMDAGVDAERAMTTPSPNCGGYNPMMYNLGTRDQRQDVYLQRHFPNQTPEATSQSQHVFLNEASRGAGRATHDFLSLYGGMPSHFVEPSPSRGASSLTTQDLLQPLERGNSPKYQEPQVLHLEKPTKEESLSQHASIPTSVVVDRLRPICMSSQLNLAMEVPQMQLLRLAGQDGNAQGVRCKTQMSLGAPLPVHEDHLLVESMRSSDVTVEQEQVENHRCWSNSRVDYALSDLLYVPKGSSNHGPVDSSYQPIPVLSRHWQRASHHPLVEVTKRPIKVPSEDEEDEVEGLDHSKEQRKDFHKGENTSRDGKNLDVRASTPRSKHSATEQRRRSKINDRFQMLRNLVPHSDQKRDKASFLLEVIDYVQMLQEKVRKFEGVEQGRHQERLKNMVWESCKKTVGPEAFMRDATPMDSAVFLKNISSSGLAVDVKQISETHDHARPKLIFSPSASENGAPTADLRPCVVPQTSSYNGRSGVINNGFDSSHDNKTCKSGVAKPSSKSLTIQHELRTTLQASLMQPLSTPDAQTFECLPKGSATTSIIDASAHRTAEPMPRANLTEQSQTRTDAKPQMQRAVDYKSSQPQEGCSAQVIEPMSVPEKAVTPMDSIQGPSGLTIDSHRMHNSYHGNGVIATNKEEVCSYKSKHKVDSCATHIREESLGVTGGIISVSSIYSQELLDTLTRALQSSGLDLSQANISVQIDLGKRVGASAVCSSDKTTGHTPESSSQSQQSKGHARPVEMRSESDVPCKKPKLQDLQEG
ncbi:hypothetical protein O6H91_10G008300 [Diphasiastrum complanatum]|uniref:Uncharacterized protein n=6 Tax=Diphasiastrum complanatum TaxID=34168 RepID=A0ACC2CEQ3_DIPCM|nr:hypothetical protein O6H91_10G008300 [Diphasiastrum complanatum]KAJ7540308.1 hypothetical protein O6H91_10G008300 [Diphasiastrum complanatum]KAJ7540309.1 hypothetical protein O6H91_10G008300 [Diphasiastrum complanatum]